MIRRAILILLVVTPGCATALDAGWRTTAGVMHASTTTGKQLAKLAQDAGTDEPGACREWRGHLERWQQYARPAVRTGVAGAASTLRVAESVGNNKADWMTALKAAGCGLWQSLKAWGHRLPDKGQSALTALSWLDPLMCTPPKAAAGGVVVAVLTIGLEVFRWLTDIIGAPTDKIKAEVAAWLAAPPADETEPVLKALKAKCP
jgi:hypothetical protein